jgi:NarL family two-component system response regulator LiaR
MPPIRIMIADDTALLRMLLAAKLAQEPDFRVVGEAENGRDAVDMALRLRPDVVLMDLDMPVLNGSQATERILAQLPYTKVILITALEDLASVARLSGAVDSLGKSCTPDQLAAAIRRAHTAAAIPVPESPDHQAAVERLARRSGLSDRERQVLELLVATDHTARQIAVELAANVGEPVTESAVKHTIERVMTKLRVEPRTRAALVKRVLER